MIELPVVSSVSGKVISEREITNRRVDAHCLDCGQGMAFATWCFSCGSKNMEYRTHPETPLDEALWCGRRRNWVGNVRPQDR